jgi:hypothetical protein
MQNLKQVEAIMKDKDNLIVKANQFMGTQLVHVTDTHLSFEDKHGNAERLSFNELNTDRAGFTAASPIQRSQMMASAFLSQSPQTPTTKPDKPGRVYFRLDR